MTDTASDGLPGNDNSNGAVKVARSMYQGNSKTTVKSTLCYGVQWDASLQFIDPDYTDYAKEGKGKGNDTGTIAVTGNDINYYQKNIADMSGNVTEWTMEAYNTNNRITRGGKYNYEVVDLPSSCRMFNNPSEKYNDQGFRVTLYL